MNSKNILVIFFGVVSELVFPGIRGDCWDTGCQLNSWATVGCAQYGRVESGRKDCVNGHIFSCCTSTPNQSSPPSGRGDCWDTGCQLNSWTTVGCAQYGRVETGKRDCANGHIFSCCTSTPNQSSPPSGQIDINFDQFSKALTANGYPAPSDSQFNSFMAGISEGSISDKQEAAMALANFMQESDGLRAKREYACNGNNCASLYRTPGCDIPEQYYFGRGYIQLSWCYNYKAASQALFNDDRLVRDPDQVAQNEQTSWDTAFWFWKVNVHSKPGVSEGKFGATTRAINGALECDGPNKGVARKRFELYGKVRTAFGLQGQGNENGCYN